MANFDSEVFGLVFPGFQATQNFHTQNSRPELSAFLSNFTFLNPKCIHGDFLLTGETKILFRSAFLVVWSAPICSDFLFVPICFQSKQEQIRANQGNPLLPTPLQLPNTRSLHPLVTTLGISRFSPDPGALASKAKAPDRPAEPPPRTRKAESQRSSGGLFVFWGLVLVGACLLSLFKASKLWETDFYTPPVLGGAALFENSVPAVYKIQGP